MAPVRQHSKGDRVLSPVALHGLYFGAYRSNRQADSLEAVELLPLEVIAFDGGDARQASEVRAVLADAGTPIGPMDVLIAGQARARNLVVVSRHVREFLRVPGLTAEDWEA